MKMRATLLALLGAGIITVGCGGDPPKTELDAANAALQAAKSADAGKYASSELSSAEGANNKANGAYTEQDGKLFKDWDSVKPLISDAKSKADQAKSSATKGKGRAKSAAESAIASADAAVSAARASLSGAPSGKGTEGDIEQLGADLDAASAGLSAARSAASREDYDAASSGAKAAAAKATGVAGGVDQAVARYNELVENNTPWYMRM